MNLAPQVSPELLELMLKYFRTEVVPDRNYLVDDCDLAEIVDLMYKEDLV